MAVYDVRDLGTDFVIHYGGEPNEIDAFTFSNSLIAVGNALQAINGEINPGHSLEISVVALGGGSFRPRIRAKAKRLANLLATDFRSVVVQVLAAFIIHRYMDADPDVVIKIESDHVEIRSEGGDVLILPKDAFNAYRRVEGNPDLDRSVRQTFEVLEEDDAVSSFGFARSPAEREQLPFDIPRGRFGDVARPAKKLAVGQQEVIEEDARLQILRAIFEDSARRWQFVWRGIRVSAPVLDLKFREQIVSGQVSITHGDIFVADLRIVQTAHESGIWINDSYEVVKVKDHQKTAPTVQP